MKYHHLDSLHHYLNPLHIYCRLVDMGVNKSLALKIARTYEILIYFRKVHKCMLNPQRRFGNP